MDDLTTKRNPTSHDLSDPERLAALVTSRLCHDLISPLGAIGNGLELLQMAGGLRSGPDSPEMALISDSVDASRARLRWFRIAFGPVAPEQRSSLTEMAALLADMERGGRLRVRIDAEGDMPRIEARMILLGLMCLETALPWGGSILVCRGAVGWRLVAEAARTRPDPALWSWLDAAAGRELPAPSPSEVHFPVFATLSAREARPISWELDEKGGEISF
ncbi:histidine phosphotransferase family protein [Paracoccus ravus]|uniref:histidine phosphotransferase family protein n=1 Tax=Paracoccus ravus TaxID=2447760 RepID=UPI00106DE336|nr:histidine phosphotransferase family protein [Paracoccus ravus]